VVETCATAVDRHQPAVEFGDEPLIVAELLEVRILGRFCATEGEGVQPQEVGGRVEGLDQIPVRPLDAVAEAQYITIGERRFSPW